MSDLPSDPPCPAPPLILCTIYDLHQRLRCASGPDCPRRGSCSDDTLSHLRARLMVDKRRN